MAGDLHEVSTAIGRLQEADLATKAQLRAIWDRLDEIKTIVVEQSRKTDDVVRNVSDVREKVDVEVMPTVEEMNALKQRGIGLLAAVGLVTGTLGLFAHRIVEAVWQRFFG